MMDLRVLLGNDVIPIPRRCRPRQPAAPSKSDPPATRHAPTLEALRAMPGTFTSTDWRNHVGATHSVACARLKQLTDWSWLERVHSGIRNTYSYRLTDTGRAVLNEEESP